MGRDGGAPPGGGKEAVSGQLSAVRRMAMVEFTLASVANEEHPVLVIALVLGLFIGAVIADRVIGDR